MYDVLFWNSKHFGAISICRQALSRFLAFSKRAFHSNVPSHLVPSTFWKPIFEGRGAVPGTVPLHTLGSTSQQEPTCLRGWYQVRFFFLWSLDLFLGVLGASGRDQGGTWYGTSAKPQRHFTKGMFGKRWALPRLNNAIARNLPSFWPSHIKALFLLSLLFGDSLLFAFKACKEFFFFALFRSFPSILGLRQREQILVLLSSLFCARKNFVSWLVELAENFSCNFLWPHFSPMSTKNIALGAFRHIFFS